MNRVNKVDKRAESFVRADGCEVVSKCVDCQLPECNYDIPGGLAGRIRVARDARLVELVEKQGLKVREVAKSAGVSVRTVYRAIAEAASKL